MNSALVVISHYNAWPTDQLVSLLDQIRDIPAGHPFRCVIVVNQAEDRPLELPPEHADIEVLYRENTGYNIGAWEYGWRMAPRADYYLFLQEECRLIRPDWLGSFVRQLSNPRVGLVGECVAWPGLSWDRLEYLNRGHFYQDGSDDPQVGVIDGIKRFLGARGVPIGESGEHIRSFILAARREVLEAIDGFMIGLIKGDAIACEIGISRTVASRGMTIKQVDFRPFRYITHPQWFHFDRGVYSRLLEWAERFAPLPLIEPAKGSIYHLQRIITGKPNSWELQKMARAGRSASGGGPGSD